MRVTTNMQNQAIFNLVNGNQVAIANLQAQMASGHKVNSASDNPSAVPSIMDARTMLNKITTYLNNITFLNGETEVTDGVLGQVADKVQRVRDLTIEAANGTNSPAQLKLINDEVQQIKEYLVATANTQYENIYIFSGTRTKTPTYVIDADGSIRYQGTPSTDNYQRKATISDKVTITVNTAGDKIFGYSNLVEAGPPPVYAGEGLFQALNELTAQLTADNPDYNNIRSHIADFDKAISKVTAARTEIGGVQSRLNMTKEQHEDNEVTYESLRANFQDIDIAKVVSDLSSQEVSLQASLYLSSQVMGMSLLNYL